MKTTEIISKLKKIVEKIGILAAVCIILATGFTVGYYYNKLRESMEPNSWKEVKTLQNTSVAINESGELLLIDRKDGDFTIYEDKVGKTIFEMYAAKTYYKSIEKP